MAIGKRKVDRYLELFEAFTPKPIRSERDLERVQKVVNGLLDRDEWNKDERDYLEVLGTLIEAYEAAHVQIDDVSNVVMLEHLIESKAMKQRQVAAETGLPESTLSDLLAGRRDFNRSHIEKLAAYFHVSPAVFCRVEKTEKETSRGVRR